MCASKFVYFYTIRAFVKVYRFACAHFILLWFMIDNLEIDYYGFRSTFPFLKVPENLVTNTVFNCAELCQLDRQLELIFRNIQF